MISKPRLITAILALFLATATACQNVSNFDTLEQRPAGLPSDINDKFTSQSLVTEDYVDRWEVESREIYLQRHLIASTLDLREGMSIADIGAGTGLFEGLFSVSVGASGRVHAVDISTVFLDDLDRRIKAESWTNVETNLSDGILVPRELQGIDRVFICDTYHHFEHPQATMSSLFRAMNPGGILVLVDFERIPGRTKEWILEHVRAGKSTFRAEIEAAGFHFFEEPVLPGMKENYLLRFLRP